MSQRLLITSVARFRDSRVVRCGFATALPLIARSTLFGRVAYCMDKASCSSEASTSSGGSKKSTPLVSIVSDAKKTREQETMERLLSKVSDTQLIKHTAAKRRYHLDDKHLVDLPVHANKRSAFFGEPKVPLYSERDIIKRARQVHGSAEAVARLWCLSAELQEHFDDERTSPSFISTERRCGGDVAAADSGSVVHWALGMNVLDATIKYAAWWISGSHALFAEAIHSTADTINQVVLAFGVHSSRWKPNKMFPYGYGQMRYVTSLISGVGIFFVGCGLSLYHGIVGIVHPVPLEPLTYAYLALGTSFIFQLSSVARAFYTLHRRAKQDNCSTYKYITDARDPSLNVILMEDTAAVLGVFIALGAISLSSFTQLPFYDAFGSILIGTLLGSVASVIISVNSQHLVGRSIPDENKRQLIEVLRQDPVVNDVHDVKATVIGPEEVRLKAEIDFCGAEITRAYLNDVDLDDELDIVKQIKTKKELVDFLVRHGIGITDRTGVEVDRVESQIKKINPRIRHIDLEAL